MTPEGPIPIQEEPSDGEYFSMNPQLPASGTVYSYGRRSSKVLFHKQLWHVCLLLTFWPQQSAFGLPVVGRGML